MQPTFHAYCMGNGPATQALHPHCITSSHHIASHPRRITSSMHHIHAFHRITPSTHHVFASHRVTSAHQTTASHSGTMPHHILNRSHPHISLHHIHASHRITPTEPLMRTFLQGKTTSPHCSSAPSLRGFKEKIQGAYLREHLRGCSKRVLQKQQALCRGFKEGIQGVYSREHSRGCSKRALQEQQAPVGEKRVGQRIAVIAMIVVTLYRPCGQHGHLV
eukprot:1161997-Pelagomonas_calceolata.AAC.5